MNRYLIGAIISGLWLVLTAHAASPAEEAAAARTAGNFPKAIALFDQALAQDPVNLTLLGQLGTVQGWAGRYDDALGTFERALRLAPDDAELRLGRARVLAWSGQQELALAEANALVAANPDNHDARILWARIQSWRRNYAEAESAYRSVIAARPDSVDALEGLGDLRKWQDRPTEARDLYQRALEHDPQYAGLRRKLGSMPHPGRWRLDLDHELSAFVGQDRSDWNETSASLSHTLDRRTSVSLNVLSARRFGYSDTQYGFVLGRRFDDRRAGYIGASLTPAAEFLAKHTLSTGGSWRIHETGDGWPATFLTGDYRLARYGDRTAHTITVGPQHQATRGLSGTVRLIGSRSLDGQWKPGWMARLDAEPLERWHWFAGYADAAESISASAVDFSTPRRTRAVLAGWAWEFSAAFTVRLDYVHEWAARTPDRNVWHVGTTTRF